MTDFNSNNNFMPTQFGGQPLKDPNNVANTFVNSAGQPGTVYGNTGGAHVTTVGGAAHSTTSVGGLGQGAEYGVHVNFDGQGNVTGTDFFGPR